MGITTTEISMGSFLPYIYIGLILFFGMELIRYILPFLLRNNKIKTIISRFFPLTELFVMFAYTLWITPLLYSKSVVLGRSFILVAFIILILITWYGIKDIVAGMIFKSGRDIQKGKEIKAFPYKGKIEHLGLRNLIIKTDEDKSIYLPYSNLINREIEIHSNIKNLHKLQFECIVASVDNPQLLIQKINKAIMLMPWVSAEEAPKIEIQKIEDKKVFLQIGVFALSTEYYQAIEKQIRDKFELDA